MSIRMLKTTRSRILAVCTAMVAFSLAINTFLNYSIAKRYNDEAIGNTLNSLAGSHGIAIGEWVSSRTLMLTSLKEPALSDTDPVPLFRQMAAADNFINIYMGYADRSSKFAERGGLPEDYDPTTRPWYRQALQEGKTLVTVPYVDMVTNELVVSIVTPIADGEGTTRGVLGSDLSMRSVIENVRSIQPTPSSRRPPAWAC